MRVGVSEHVLAFKREDESVEGEDGCSGSLEVEVWFSTYQRLFPAPAPHPRPPTV